MDEVGEFVRNEPLSLARPGRVLAPAEYDIVTHGEGPDVERAGKLGGTRVAMDPDPAELVAEAGLEECTERWRQGLAATAQPADLGPQARPDLGHRAGGAFHL